MADPIKRLNYFNGQFLRAPDFNDDQRYHLELERDHARLMHTPGIASGLEVPTPAAGASGVTVNSGIAFDDQGRRIVLANDLPLELASQPADQTVYVTISYAESPTDPTEETGISGNTRWTEAPRIEALPSAPGNPMEKLVLARIERTGTVISTVHRDDRRAAGVKGGDLEVRKLTLTSEAIAPAGWVTAQLGASKRADLDGSLRVTGDLVVTGSIQGNIAVNTIETGDLVDGAVTSVKLADNAVSTAKVTDSNITTAKLADAAVTLAKLANNSVDASKIVDASISTGKLADLAVTNTKLADNAVSTSKVVDANITTAKLADAAVTLAKLANNSVDASKIVDASITTGELANLSVTTAKLADSAVSTIKVVDANITTAKLADTAVTTAKLADAAVTFAKLSPNSVDASKLVDASVGTAELANGAVTSVKLESSVSSMISGALQRTGGTVSGDLSVTRNVDAWVTLAVANPNTGSGAATVLAMGTGGATDARIIVYSPSFGAYANSYTFAHNRAGGWYRWTTGGAVKMALTNDGHLGIGTDAPGADFLDVRGRCYSSGGWQTTNADYAEYFETQGGKEIPVGTPVCLSDGKVTAAKKGDVPIGIVTKNSAVIGNSYKEWPQKYLRDAFGNPVMESVKVEVLVPKKERVEKQRQKVKRETVQEQVVHQEIVLVKGKHIERERTETLTRELETPVFEEVDVYDKTGEKLLGKRRIPVMETYVEEVAVLDANGDPVMCGSGELKTEKRPKLNPEFDAKREYTPRSERAEWCCVGLLGQLPLRKGKPVAPGWVKIKDLADHVELWLVK